MTEPSRICAWMTWGSMWNLIIEIRKSATHSLVPYPAYLSQWSLTFEVRKRLKRAIDDALSTEVAMEPDL